VRAFTYHLKATRPVVMIGVAVAAIGLGSIAAASVLHNASQRAPEATSASGLHQAFHVPVSGLPLQGVTAQQLADHNLNLRAPTGPATVSADAAWQKLVALRPGFGDRQIASAVLANVATPLDVNLQARPLSWVFSLVPSSAPAQANGQLIHAKYDLVMIDATTGQWYEEFLGGPTTPLNSP
jgi:hypothetical protein